MHKPYLCQGWDRDKNMLCNRMKSKFIWVWKSLDWILLWITWQDISYKELDYCLWHYCDMWRSARVYWQLIFSIPRLDIIERQTIRKTCAWFAESRLNGSLFDNGESTSPEIRTSPSLRANCLSIFQRN